MVAFCGRYLEESIHAIRSTCVSERIVVTIYATHDVYAVTIGSVYFWGFGMDENMCKSMIPFLV